MYVCVCEREMKRERVCVCVCVQCDDSRDGMGATASNRTVGDGGMKEEEGIVCRRNRSTQNDGYVTFWRRSAGGR